MRRRQLAAMTNWVIASARSQPVVLALEADPTTLDFIRGIVERGALAPLLLLITARPEFRAPWAIRSHHATISLAPLDRSQVREMVAELSARHALPKQIVDGVTERTGGVPLFVEEVTRAPRSKAGSRRGSPWHSEFRPRSRVVRPTMHRTRRGARAAAGCRERR
jgi:predicted ATPase